MAHPFLSIVIPAYNEEARIAQTLDTVAAYAGSQDYSWEVVVADDGSVDSTAALVEAAAREHNEIRLVRLPHGGKGSAVRAGMLEASGEYRFQLPPGRELSRSRSVYVRAPTTPTGRRRDGTGLWHFRTTRMPETPLSAWEMSRSLEAVVDWICQQAEQSTRP